MPRNVASRKKRKRYFLDPTLSQERRNEDRPRPPPGLRGKAIGLFYRDLARSRRPERDHTIKFNIPSSVVKRVHVLLQGIAATNTGKKLKQLMKNCENSSLFSKSEKSCAENLKNESEYKQPSPVVPCPDFIPIKVEKESYVYPNHNITSVKSIDERQINESIKSISFTAFSANTIPSNTDSHQHLKSEDCLPYYDTTKPGSSTSPEEIHKEVKVDSSSYNFESILPALNTFKYDYNDIITGTFEEKLDQCLAENINLPATIDMASLNEAYYLEYQDIITRSKFINMLEFRKKLPTYQKSKELLKVIEDNRVVVISGETGCGKSTQVPQIILDNAILNKKGAGCKVVVTQPRRIAASSLAARVAEERGERMGVSVGYSVRLERIEARSVCSITYCTTGVLLSDLETNQGLTNYSHVILDEVHERDTNIDLTMCMLKQIIEKRKDLKVILMSATLDADRLSKYFNGCPLLHIEGLAYPVKDIYLEEILHITNYTLKENTSGKKSNFNQRQHNRFDMEKDVKHKMEVGPWLDTIKTTLTSQVYRALLDYRIEILDMDLILELLVHISKGDPGAILVFVPGIGEISKLIRLMNDSGLFPKCSFDIYPLHSKLASLDQHRIFKRPPQNVRKIIVATNIAETSLTIDDIVYVIDSGKMKITGLNVEDNVATLNVEWVAQANLRQRRGRAGRCQPGICYHVLTTYRASTLDERTRPELQRSDLLEAVLTIKKLRLGKAAEALTLVPDPPALSTIKWAVSHLRQCGALNEDEVLTPLGWHLARLPAHPAAGKLLILGALFGCIDRAASIAAMWGFKDPFQLVIGKEQLADEKKRALAAGEPSDHVAMAEALARWEAADDRRAFAYNHFLSHNTLELLVQMKRQFGDNLKNMGFLPSGNVKSRWENRNNDNCSLFKAIVAASLYPNVATVNWLDLNHRNSFPRVRVRLPECSVQLHPSSVMGRIHKGRNTTKPLCDKPGANWLTYWIKRKSTNLHLIDVTLVYTLPLLFFGQLSISDVVNSPDDCVISICEFRVQCKKEAVRLLFELRSLLDHVLASKVSTTTRSHSEQHDKFEQLVLDAVIEMITAEDEGTQYMSDDDDDDDNDDFSSDVLDKPHRRKY